MDLDQCTNYKKRDIYLKKHGEKLFKKFPLRKTRGRKLQIEIKRQTEYLPNKKGNCNKFLDGLSKIIKYKYGSIVNIKQNDYNDCSKRSMADYSAKILSCEEIDMLLTAINGDDGEKYE
jgi:hypothetical protein